MRDRDGRDSVAHQKSGDHSAKVPGRKTRPETESREDETEDTDERGLKQRAKTNGSLFSGVPWSRDDDKDADHANREEEEEEENDEDESASGGDAVEAKADADSDDDDDDDSDDDDGDDGDAGDSAEQEAHEAEDEGEDLKAKAEGEVAGDGVGKQTQEADDAQETQDAQHAKAKTETDGDDDKDRALAFGDHDSDGATDDVDEESEEEFEAEAFADDGKHADEHEENEEEYSEGQAQLDQQLEPGGEGQRIDRRIQHRLEQEMGYSLENVRVHTGGATQSKLQQHAILGAAKGRNILLADASQAQDYDLMRHEVAHVVQQGSGKVSPKLGNTERAKHESDADRHTHKRHHELKELSAPTTGPAQFRLAYDGPPPTVKRPAPKPRPAPRPRPAPPPPPRYTAPVIQKRTMGSDYVPPVVQQRRKAQPKPKPYVLTTQGDTHWNDSNLRGQSVNTKVQRWKQKHSHQQALANAQARKTGGDPPNLMPKLTKQEKKDLGAFRRSERLAQDGALFAKGIREKREAEERKRLEEERKKRESGGFWGGLKKIAKGAGKVAVKATHVGLDVAGYVPGPIGSGASAANAGIYFAEGNESKGKEKMIEAAVGLIPVPGAKVAGKIVQKAAFKGASKVAAQKAGSKAGTTVISAAARGKRMIYQNRGQIRKAGQDMYQDIAKDQAKAIAKDKTNATQDGYDPLKTLRDTFVSKAKGKVAKKLAVKNPRKAALDASAYAKKKVALMPVPEGARKFAEKHAQKYAAKLARNTETVAAVGVDQVETQVKAEVDRDKKRDKKKKA